MKTGGPLSIADLIPAAIRADWLEDWMILVKVKGWKRAIRWAVQVGRAHPELPGMPGYDLLVWERLPRHLVIMAQRIEHYHRTGIKPEKWTP